MRVTARTISKIYTPSGTETVVSETTGDMKGQELSTETKAGVPVRFGDLGEGDYVRLSQGSADIKGIVEAVRESFFWAHVWRLTLKGVDDQFYYSSDWSASLIEKAKPPRRGERVMPQDLRVGDVIDIYASADSWHPSNEPYCENLTVTAIVGDGGANTVVRTSDRYFQPVFEYFDEDRPGGHWIAYRTKKAKPSEVVNEVEAKGETVILKVTHWSEVEPDGTTSLYAPEYVIYMESNGKMHWHSWNDYTKLAGGYVNAEQILDAEEVVLSPKGQAACWAPVT